MDQYSYLIQEDNKSIDFLALVLVLQVEDLQGDVVFQTIEEFFKHEFEDGVCARYMGKQGHAGFKFEIVGASEYFMGIVGLQAEQNVAQQDQSWTEHPVLEVFGSFFQVFNGIAFGDFGIP